MYTAFEETRTACNDKRTRFRYNTVRNVSGKFRLRDRAVVIWEGRVYRVSLVIARNVDLRVLDWFNGLQKIDKRFSTYRLVSNLDDGKKLVKNLICKFDLQGSWDVRLIKRSGRTDSKLLRVCGQFRAPPPPQGRDTDMSVSSRDGLIQSVPRRNFRNVKTSCR